MWWFEKTAQTFKGFNITQLSTDEAWMNISSSFDKPVWLYLLSNDCYQCPFKKFLEEPILPDHSYKAKIKVQHGSSLRFRTAGNSTYAHVLNDSFKICDLNLDIGEFGVYSLTLDNESLGSASCVLETDLEPVDIYLKTPYFDVSNHKIAIPAVITLWIILGLIFSILPKGNVYHYVYSRAVSTKKSIRFQRNETQELTSSSESIPEQRLNDENEPKPSTSNPTLQKLNEDNDNENRPLLCSKDADEIIQSNTPASIPCASLTDIPQLRKERLKSLDVFRGLCIVIMIFVDDGGGGYYFFQHCTWDGLYVADLAFPWFLWICGVCIPLSLNVRKANTSKFVLFQEIITRSFKLIMLGMMVNTSSNATPVQLGDFRLPGVLQRFGICYFVGCTLFLMIMEIKPPEEANTESDEPNCVNSSTFGDILIGIVPWIFVIICVLIHTLITFTLAVPDCPTGYIGPAGLHLNNIYLPKCVGGAAGYIDRTLFGTRHIHNFPTSKKVYGSGPFDPEGTLGILNSVFHIWLGVQTGITILFYKTSKARLLRFSAWAVVLMAGGLILCGGYENNGWVPINKNLWSISFVFITTSFAFTLLSLLFLVIDVLKIWNGSPFMECGKNSIFLYLGHEVCHAMIPWHYAYGQMQTHMSKMFESSWGTVLWMYIAIYLYNKQLFFVV